MEKFIFSPPLSWLDVAGCAKQKNSNYTDAAIHKPFEEVIKKIIFLLFVFLFAVGPKGYTQTRDTLWSRTGIGVIWVTPKHSSAFPDGNNRSWNAGLNLAFEDYHVAEYRFLDSLYTSGYINKFPVYEIRLEDDYADAEFDFYEVLGYCYKPLLNMIGRPYIASYHDGGDYTINNGEIVLDFSQPLRDPSILPCSATYSCNEELNAILEQYNVLSYKYEYAVLQTGDTSWRQILITCDYSDILNLYYALLPLNHLFEYVSITANSALADIGYDCGNYNGIDEELKTPITVAPNPVQNTVTISGVNAQLTTLYDGQGRVVFSATGHIDKINMTHLPKGIYLLHIISDKGAFYVEKLIKQ